MLGISIQSCRMWSHSLTYEELDNPAYEDPAHSHEIGSGNQTNSMHWGENVPCTIAEGLRYHNKIGRGSHVVLLKIIDAELQCGDSEQALIHFSVSPSSVKHQSRCERCGNFGENAYIAAARKLRKRGYTPQRSVDARPCHMTTTRTWEIADDKPESYSLSCIGKLKVIGIDWRINLIVFYSRRKAKLVSWCPGIWCTSQWYVSPSWDCVYTFIHWDLK